MTIRSGELKTLIEIQAAIDVRDASGGAEPQWQKLCECYAKWEMTSGNESMSGNQPIGVASHLLTIRFRGGLDRKLRVIGQGRTLDVNSVMDPDGRREMLLLRCTEAIR